MGASDITGTTGPSHDEHALLEGSEPCCTVRPVDSAPIAVRHRLTKAGRYLAGLAVLTAILGGTLAYFLVAKECNAPSALLESRSGVVPTSGTSPLSPPQPVTGSTLVKASNDDAGPVASHGDSDPPNQALEISLLKLLPGSNHEPAGTEPSLPFGYVCFFYGARPSPKCELGDVRLVGRRSSRPVTDEVCSIQATLYFARMRAPNRPEPDASGVRALESDGELFLYGEVQDYVIEVLACPERRTEAHRQVTQWLKRATRTLARQ